MSTFIVSYIMIGGGVMAMLFVAFTCRKMNKDFKKWFDENMWDAK